MVCTNPLYICYLKNGKKFFTHSKDMLSTTNQNDYGVRIEKYDKVPCQKCLSCRIQKAKEWSIRCIHELRYHKASCFITLTYDKDNVPDDYSLNKANMTCFIKRLRKHFPNVKIQYLQCGEYGSKRFRPHHHMVLYGLDFKEDRKLFEKTYQNNYLYRSKTLESIWGYGMCVIGELTMQSVQYVCRYTLKKQYGSDAIEHYGKRIPEYITSSKRPAIGRKFFEQFQSDIYPHDYIVLNGQKYKVPRYYDFLLNNINPSLLESIKLRRREFALLYEKSCEELLQINFVLTSRLQKLIKPLELLI